MMMVVTMISIKMTMTMTEIARTVASLRLVSPGATTDGFTPIFFRKKLTTFFAHFLSILLISFGYHPLEGVTPHLFHLSNLVCKLFFVNLPTNKFFVRVSPPSYPPDGGDTRTQLHGLYSTFKCSTNYFVGVRASLVLDRVGWSRDAEGE